LQRRNAAQHAEKHVHHEIKLEKVLDCYETLRRDFSPDPYLYTQAAEFCVVRPQSQ